MIQFTKEFRNKLARQERIDLCLNGYIDADGNVVNNFEIFVDAIEITRAYVNSTSSAGTHTVTIDESEKLPKSTHCTCDGCELGGRVCIHMIAIDTYYKQIAAIFAPVAPSAEEIAAQAEESNMVKLAEYRRGIAVDAYEILSETKKTTKWVYSLECPHMVPVGMEHSECGACLDKLYG